MKRVACYCRVSTEEQAKFGYSIQAQKDALEKYCKAHNYKYDFYVDEGISASSMKKRKALNEILYKSNTYDMILFTKLDRLSRNVLDANNINKILNENNCTMKAIDEDDVDTTTADGIFIFNLKVSLAQREIGKTAERINFVFQNKREKGEVTSGTKKYGYDIINKHYVINKEEQENLIKLYKYNISVNGNKKETYSYFVIHFPGKGIDAMEAYLSDTSYIGKYKLYRKNIYLDNYIPRLMTDELFFEVQKLKKKKTIMRDKTINDIFSGLLYCSKCNSRLSKKVDNRTKNKTVRYLCDNSSRYQVGVNLKKCYNSKTIREDYVEKYLLDNIDIEAQKFKYSSKAYQQETKPKNLKELKNIENKINKLKDLYLDDLIDKETYKADYNKYTSQKNKLLQETEVIETKKDFTKLNTFLNSNYKNIYSKLNINNKKKFWLNIIDKIYVEDGKIKEITFL